MRLLLYALIGVGQIIPSFIHARPVSYPGGWTAMFMNDGDKNSAYIHYSPTAKTAIGYKFEYWRDKDMTLNAIQMNNLLKRWNNPDSQANFYLKSGVGSANSDAGDFDGETNMAGFIGIATDWEDRQYYFSYENRYTAAGEIDDFFQQSARIGWAPYQGDYGDLHTWLMVQVAHMPEADDNFTATPLVRLFKDVHMLEAGMNNRGDVLFNYIFRY